VDHDWVVAFYVEDADLEQCPVCCWADEHCQGVIEKYSSHRIANGMPYIRVGDPVLSRWLADPHLDNIACLPDDIVARLRQRVRLLHAQRLRLQDHGVCATCGPDIASWVPPHAVREDEPTGDHPHGRRQELRLPPPC